MAFLDRLHRQAIVIPSLEELQAEFEEQVESDREESKMPLLSQIETRAIRREALRSARESLVEVLDVRFEEVPEASLASEELR